MRFVVNSQLLSKEELERICKQADPGAEVLADGSDAAVFVWSPEVLRRQLSDCLGLDGEKAGALAGGRLCGYLKGVGESLLEGYGKKICEDFESGVLDDYFGAGLRKAGGKGAQPHGQEQ